MIAVVTLYLVLGFLVFQGETWTRLRQGRPPGVDDLWLVLLWGPLLLCTGVRLGWVVARQGWRWLGTGQRR